MRRIVGILAASAVLSGTAVAVTAVSSSAATIYGPYSTRAECEKAKANTRAMAGQTFSGCAPSRVRSQHGYYFIVG